MSFSAALYAEGGRLLARKYHENIDSKLNKIKSYEQYEFHKKVEQNQSVGDKPMNSYGIADYFPQANNNRTWVLWKPEQDESEFEANSMTREEALQRFKRDYLPEALKRGYLYLLTE